MEEQAFIQKPTGFMRWVLNSPTRLFRAKPSLILKIIPTFSKIGEEGRAKDLASPEPDWSTGRVETKPRGS